MGADTGRTLAWILLDVSGRYFWGDPGFRPLPAVIDLASLVTWPSRGEAHEAAKRAAREYGVQARPAALRLP